MNYLRSYFLILACLFFFCGSAKSQDKHTSVLSAAKNKVFYDNNDKWVFLFQGRYLIVQSKDKVLTEKFSVSKIDDSELVYDLPVKAGYGKATISSKWTNDGYGNTYYYEPLFINVYSNLVQFSGNVTSSNFRKRKKQKEIEERQKEIEERKKKLLRNGTYKEYYSNGALLRIVNYKKFKGKNGVEQYYYKNGKLQSESNYKDGNIDGVYAQYSENGKPSRKHSYKDGRRDGVWSEYFQNGKLKSESNYKDGQSYGVWTEYYENGKLKSESN